MFLTFTFVYFFFSIFLLFGQSNTQADKTQVVGNLHTTQNLHEVVKAEPEIPLGILITSLSEKSVHLQYPYYVHIGNGNIMALYPSSNECQSYNVPHCIETVTAFMNTHRLAEQYILDIRNVNFSQLYSIH